MRIIRPIVNVSKLIENYDVFFISLMGVLHKDAGVKADAINAVKKLKENNKKVVIITNTPIRVKYIIEDLEKDNVDVSLFDGIISSGEILHYMLKNKSRDFSYMGNKYFQIGKKVKTGVFDNIDYHRTENINEADFIYISHVNSSIDKVEDYLQILEYGISRNIPFLCAMNDTASYYNGDIGIAPGAVAEQYALLGGRIITVGKPQQEIFNYCLEGLRVTDKSRVVMIGDCITTDIKGANLASIDSVLISHGIHVNYLGEGFIPDVEKTRNISSEYEAYPDWVISHFRW